MSERIIDYLVNILWDTPLTFAIILTGVYFTIENRFFQINYLIYAFRNLFTVNFYIKAAKYLRENKSSIGATSLSIGSTVGIGSIGGVATAIAIGGPGAIFWMWIAAFFGMIIKTAEVTLAVYYRSKDKEGNIYGGPTAYIEKGIGIEMNFRSWLVPVAIFSIGITSTIFISSQNYIASKAISSTFGINIFIVSILYSAVVFLFIRRKAENIGRLFIFIIPVITSAYIIIGLIIMVADFRNIPSAFGLIINDAFHGTSALGGFTGATLSQVITMGVTQAVYSSEFGWGTSPIVHSVAKINHPVKQGLWGGFEVFFTTIICSITAFVIILSGEWTSGQSGLVLSLNSFESFFGVFGRYIITIIIFFFALTTSIGWFTYNEIIFRHLFRNRSLLKGRLINCLKFLYPFPEFLFVVYITVFHLSEKYVWSLTNITVAFPTFINIISILILSNQFRKLVLDYKARYLKIGKVDADMHLFYEDKEKKA
ncbi:alanine/glycine:cation symporter family protein [Bacillus sp. JJ722]|uniref:alanine/glycine:cation symporter family protein n=1 Tax=Bacillus sp. JJ722 TaxID=3122973 RepID=UPI002FFDFFE0